MKRGPLYVGCGLTEAPTEFVQEIEDFKQGLRSDGHEVFDFVGLVNGTARDVYEWDIGYCVENCSGFIAVCDYPSTGLGYELRRAVELRKPTIATAHRDRRVTRLVLGAAEVEPNITFERYDRLIDMVPVVGRLLVPSTKNA